MVFDQDFEGYDKPLKARYVCPACGRKISAILSMPERPVLCLAKVPCARPRQKGTPRTVPCGAEMKMVKPKQEKT